MRTITIVAQTTRRTERTSKYIAELAKYKPLTDEELSTLCAAIQQGNKKALDKLIKHNLRFVVSVAKKYSTKGMTIDDLIQFGNIGLIKAAQNFDFTLGNKFTTYAVEDIRKAIIDGIMDTKSVVRVPRYAHYDGVSVSQFSGDALVGNSDDANASFFDLQTSEFNADKGTDKADVLITLQQAFVRLTPAERKVIIYSFGIGIEREYSLFEISQQMQLTKERIRQIQKEALSKLKGIL